MRNVLSERAAELWRAQEIAEKQGENDFVCPLCGGKAWWSRSEYNGYIHLYTCHYNANGNKCGIGILHKCEEVKKYRATEQQKEANT